MKALERLIRLRKQKIDAQRNLLSQIEDRIERLEKELKDLHETLLREEELAQLSIEASLMFPDYAKRVRLRSLQVNRYLQEVLLQLDKERDKLSGYFSDLKVLEIALKNRVAQQKQQQDLKEQTELDDLTLMRRGRG